MTDWMVITLLLVTMVYASAPHLLGVSLYKLSLVTLAATVGYWIDRGLFPYARPNDIRLTDPIERSAAMIRRAVIVGACVVGVSLGS